MTAAFETREQPAEVVIDLLHQPEIVDHVLLGLAYLQRRAAPAVMNEVIEQRVLAGFLGGRVAAQRGRHIARVVAAVVRRRRRKWRVRAQQRQVRNPRLVLLLDPVDAAIHHVMGFVILGL